MMKFRNLSRLLIGAGILALGLQHCLAVASAEESKVITESKSMNSGLNIEASKIDPTKKAAARGDSNAAMRLASYYSFVIHDYDQATYWYSVGAENGYTVAMFSLAQTLHNKTDEISKLRAEFWYRKVMASGEKPYSDLAKTELGE